MASDQVRGVCEFLYILAFDVPADSDSAPILNQQFCLSQNSHPVHPHQSVQMKN